MHRAACFGFEVQGLWVHDLGFRDHGNRLRVWGLGFMLLGCKGRLSDFELSGQGHT